MENNWNVYVTRKLPEPVMEKLKEFCAYDVNPEDRPLTHEELLKAVRGRDAVICLLNDKIDAQVFDAAGPRCRIFANYAVGYDNIDVAEAVSRGVMITNTPDVLTDATADMALALMFAAARRVVEADKMLRSGDFPSWAPEFMLGMDITGRTLGILGAGRIGCNLAKKALAFNMNIVYNERRPDPVFEENMNARYMSKDALLKEADFVSIHLPLKQDTYHMIGERELAMMKPTGILINTSRGPIVDEKALVAALKIGRIWGAGLDVYENEPHISEELLMMDNVVLTPHTASATVETRTNMGLVAVRNVVMALKGEIPANLIALKE